MINTKLFLNQLVNSVVLHLTQESREANLKDTCYQQFMVRSELERRIRDAYLEQPQMGLSTGERNLRVIAKLFFNGDLGAAKEQWEAASVEDPDGSYELEMKGLGQTIILAIDPTRNHRLSA